MSTRYISCEVLQVTPGQCERCGTRSVFSVLVAESTDDSDRMSQRAFYTCDRGVLPGHYFVHHCGEALREGKQSSSA
jgi:hypothetical protein